jgi:hypothetical protein
MSDITKAYVYKLFEIIRRLQIIRNFEFGYQYPLDDRWISKGLMHILI